jgi:DNA-binding winged helix-turn-helix (wHTH) protein
MVYRFGECTLDTQQHRLQRAGQPVQLRSKAFQILLYLLEHRDRTVLKQELYEHVWPQSFVSEATLESTVRAVRQAVGDSGRTQQLIHTVYGYGYRFVAAVEGCADAPSGTAGDAVRSLHVPVSTPPPADDRHTALAPRTPGAAGGDDAPCALRPTAEEEGHRARNGAVEVDRECPAVPPPLWEQKQVAVLAVEPLGAGPRGAGAGGGWGRAAALAVAAPGRLRDPPDAGPAATAGGAGGARAPAADHRGR